MSRLELPITQRLEVDQSIWLAYGRPLEGIPYQQIARTTDDGDSLELLIRAASIQVEEENNNGKPGAFVTIEPDSSDLRRISLAIRTWSYS
jgi:hypothetical protein